MNFDFLVNRIKSEKGLAKEVPGFDPENGNESAKFLSGHKGRARAEHGCLL
ncbi:MAG TPA: hypothetical protein VLC91_05965 [Spongiibacteraceae bacterium]|nr:hypothetical protein [Spongiibacteraceae bacterium]